MTVPDHIPPLVTERLVLRLADVTDAAAIHRYRSDPETTRYLSHGPLTEQATSQRLVKSLELSTASNGDWFNYNWAITLRESGLLIGDARTWNSEDLGSTGVLSPGRHPVRHAALGYVLQSHYQHRGYAREAAAALVNWLFEVRAVTTVVATAYEPNSPSINLLRSLGFTQDPVLSAEQETAGKGFPLLTFTLDRMPSAG